MILILGSLLLLGVPARLKRGYLLLIPILLFARILTMAHGEFRQAHFLQWTLARCGGGCPHVGVRLHH